MCPYSKVHPKALGRAKGLALQNYLETELKMTASLIIFQLLSSVFSGQMRTKLTCPTSWEYSSTEAIGPGNSNSALWELWDISQMGTPSSTALTDGPACPIIWSLH